MRARSRGIHTMALELRARHRSGNELARSLTSTHAIERLERQHSAQPQRIAAKSRRHGVIHHEQCAGFASHATQSAKIGHTQTKPADGIDEPPQVRPLGIKRSMKTLGRGSKRIGRRRAHEHNVAAIKAVRKSIGKVVRKGNQTIAGTHNPLLRQHRRHMRGSNQSRPTRAGPCSPSLF